VTRPATSTCSFSLVSSFTVAFSSAWYFSSAYSPSSWDFQQPSRSVVTWQLIVVFNVFAQCFRLLFLILFRRLHRCLSTTAPLWLPLCLPLAHFLFRLRRCSPSSSDVLLPLPLCLSFALFLFRSLLQFIAKLIVVFNVFAQSTTTPTTCRPTRTPTTPLARIPTSRRKGTPTGHR
jgi:hypothetical protein